MKKSILFVLLAMVLAFAGCQEDKETIAPDKTVTDTLAGTEPQNVTVTEAPEVPKEEVTKIPEPTEAPVRQRTPIIGVMDGDTLVLSGSNRITRDVLDEVLAENGLTRETLKKVVVSEDVWEIGSSFSGCIGLEEVTLLNPLESMVNGEFDGCENLKKVVLPDSVTQIGNHAFGRCTALESITLPKSLQSVGYCAFYRSGLINVDLPEGLKSIDEMAFYGCNLVDIMLPEGLEIIGKQAFDGCQNLEDIMIPESVVHIGEKAFYLCKNLKNVTLPTNLLYLGAGAFVNCPNITSELPEFAYSIVGDNEILFGGWVKDNSSLTSYEVPETLYGKTVVGIGDYAFYGFKMMTEVKLPKTIRTIGTSAFDICASLEEIVLPVSVTELGDRAFGQCYKLKSITVPASVTAIGVDAFKTNKDITVYCKKGSYAENYMKENGLNYVAE
ncbi:MAG: leucine-rich repeat domain-containing protein [Lachnospiraceae bacterium]|nr:leucine-rich repeat domain-containing protein [Lachnospiraceae bacterium]